MDATHIPLDSISLAGNEQADRDRDDHTHEIRADLAYKRIVFVNHMYLGHPGGADRSWILIDAGPTGLSAGPIKHAAEDRFGRGIRPSAIILTHGHFDHIGAAKELSIEWECPIYAHHLELPYLNGTSAYPPADPSVGGGMMSLTSGMFPSGPFDLGEWLQPLPDDGTILGFPEWKWIHAPGHSAGMIALWREKDRTLIAADAFITTDVESAYAALTQKMELQGPPMFLTPDWQAAGNTVRMLASLEPDTIVCGHGRAMMGPEMLAKLHYLAENFEQIALPKQGRYLNNPARPEDGTAYVS